MKKTLFIFALSFSFFLSVSGEEGLKTPAQRALYHSENSLSPSSHDSKNPEAASSTSESSSLQAPFTPPFDLTELPQEGDRFVKEFFNMLFTLGLILGLLLVASWLVKRFSNSKIQQMNEASNIKIIESRSLSTKTTIYVLDIMGKVLIVAESQNGVTCLGTPSEERIE